MTNEMKMFGRYAITGAVAYAAGKGWISAGAAAPVTNFLLEFAALAISALPPIYAAWKVNNAPKT